MFPSNTTKLRMELFEEVFCDEGGSQTVIERKGHPGATVSAGLNSILAWRRLIGVRGRKDEILAPVVGCVIDRDNYKRWMPCRGIFN